MESRRSPRCFLMLVALATFVAASKDTSQVDSITALQARINSAAPGDVIVLKDGVYTTSAPLTSHDRPDDTMITANTLRNNTRNYFMTARDKGLGAVRTVFANNLIEGGGPAATIDGPYPGGAWRDNLILADGRRRDHAGRDVQDHEAASRKGRHTVDARRPLEAHPDALKSRPVSQSPRGIRSTNQRFEILLGSWPYH